MAVSIIHTRALSALDTPAVMVETHLSGGLPAFNLVGLPETAVRESKDRVRSAIMNSQFEFPVSRITVNLAPADLPKEGGRFDLAIALGILAASKQIPDKLLDELEFVGELALSGALRPVTGIVNASLAALKAKRLLVLPQENRLEAALATKDQHLTAAHLLEVCAHLNGQQRLTSSCATIDAEIVNCNDTTLPDLADILGQEQAKRALQIAAIGNHNLLFSGPPGCGKSMLAERLPGILPRLSESEFLEQLALQSTLSSRLELNHQRRRPFRHPHHSTSAVAMVGGGKPLRPGEISQAHHGVLFLDELSEFARPVLDALREPLETHEISISRACGNATYPANFQLIAAMNPCPCGYAGSSQRPCSCGPEQIKRYRSKISGPLLDRIDLFLQLQPTPIALLTRQQAQPSISPSIKQHVSQLRDRQLQRQGKLNALLSGDELKQHANLTNDALILLENIAQKMQLSGRGLQRSLRVARSIADLDDTQNIEPAHIAEALGYRQQF